MLAAIREIFDKLIEPQARQPGAPSEHALQVATAALLLETMRMDDSIVEAERQRVAEALRAKFGLGEDELGALVAAAEQEARQASGYFQFTSLINKGFSPEQKLRVIEFMWQVAFADGQLDAHEQHLMRKIADLLYIPHGDYIAAKQRAREASGVPPES